MSAHISGSSGEYFGILNGVTYRIDPNVDASSRGIFRLTPLNMQPVRPTMPLTPVDALHSATADLHEAASATAISAGATPAPDLVMDQASAEKEARTAKLLKREGPEPLRAGHPALWAILVAGTCLEGSLFQAA